MKKKLLALVLAGVLLGGCGSTIPKLSDGKEAMVEFKDGTKISVDEIWNSVKENYALSTVITKIDTKVLEDKYKDKITEAEEYSENMVTSLKANYTDENGNYDESSLNSALSQYGYGNLDNYKTQQRLEYLRKLATTDYAKENVSESDMKKYYEKETVGDIDCVHILVKVSESDSDADKKAEAEKIISDIKKDIESGTSAKDAFKKYENNENVTYQELGYFNKGDMVEEFETAAYKLKVNGYSKTPVKTSYGYHVILKVGEKEKPSYKDAKDDIKTKLAEKEVSENSSISTKAMIALRKEYGVDIKDSSVETQYNNYMNNLLNQ